MKEFVKILKARFPEPLKRILRRCFSLARQTRQKSFKPYVKKKNVEGVAFDFWIGDTDGRAWYDLQSTDPSWPEMRFIRDNIIIEGDVILECGAHHGCTTTLFSKWVGDTGRVVAIEPLAKNCRIIRKNIELNKLKNVIVERKAVGAKKGRVYINDVSNSYITFSNQGAEVDLTCLDEYEHLNPTFIKIDVEGFEYQVLQGANKILSKKPKLAIEVHTDLLSRYGASVEDVLKCIDVSDYKIWIQWNAEVEPEEYDGKTSIEKRVHLFCIPGG